MPTYDYECSSCGHEFEVFQPMTAALVRKCPSCGKHKVKRLIGTGGALIFKGSGFYATDYRSSSYKEDAKKDVAPGSGGSKSESKGESKSESKSESKRESKGESKSESKSESTSEPKNESKKGKAGK